MEYLEILKETSDYDTIEEVKESCCVNILTEFTQYNFCFIGFETEDFLGIYYTSSDFTERFVLIKKKYIVSISFVYQQDIVQETPNVNEYV